MPRLIRRGDRALTLAATAAVAACGVAALACAWPARADVYGRLRFTVRLQQQPSGASPRPAAAAAAAVPAAGARVTIHDTSGVDGDRTFTADRAGTVQTPPLRDVDWALVRVLLPAAPGARQPLATQGRVVKPRGAAPLIHVLSDATRSVEITLDPSQYQIAEVAVTGAGVSGDIYRRDRDFLRKIPYNGANPQALGPLLRTVP